MSSRPVPQPWRSPTSAQGGWGTHSFVGAAKAFVATLHRWETEAQRGRDLLGVTCQVRGLD